MRSSWKIWAALILLVPLLGACGGEEKPRSCDGGLGLDGTWFGAMEDDLGSLFTMQWRVCDDRIVRQRISGVDYGTRGRLTWEAPGVYRTRFDDGTRARLLTDPSGRYGALVSEFFDFAVLEREAFALPRYRPGDLNGVWRGRQLRQSGSLLAVSDSRSDCASGFCSILDGDGDTMLLDLANLERDYGLWWGGYTGARGGGIAGALMSADREFLGTYSCPAGYGDPWDCRFGVYRRW
jgi:hypothetical protein